jgi:hypothetical protein
MSSEPGRTSIPTNLSRPQSCRIDLTLAERPRKHGDCHSERHENKLNRNHFPLFLIHSLLRSRSYLRPCLFGAAEIFALAAADETLFRALPSSFRRVAVFTPM